MHIALMNVSFVFVQCDFFGNEIFPFAIEILKIKTAQEFSVLENKIKRKQTLNEKMAISQPLSLKSKNKVYAFMILNS